LRDLHFATDQIPVKEHQAEAQPLVDKLRTARARGKPDALSAHQRLIRQRGVLPLMYQYGETVSKPTGENATRTLSANPGGL
jgi:hypothetical protein